MQISNRHMRQIHGEFKMKRLETAGQGNLRPESTPWDYNGAFWYTRLFVEF